MRSTLIVATVPSASATPDDLERARAISAANGDHLREGPVMTGRKKIVFQGEPGANSHIAREAYPDFAEAILRHLRGLLRRTR